MTTFTTTLTNPASAGSQANTILQSVQAAADQWAQYIQGAGTVGIEVTIGDVGDAIATGGSDFESTGGGLYVPDPVTTIQTGVNPSGGDPNIQLTISPDYVYTVFYDPTGTQTVPANEIDAVSVYEHEIGHGLGINYIDSSTYSQFVTTVGSQSYFDGPNATAAYGGPVPLDSSLSHVTFADLMNPATGPGVRHTISDVDLGILQDVGLPIATGRADRVTLGGADTLFSALGGDDSITAGDASTMISGNAGNDILSFGNGTDTGYGGAGNDKITAGNGNDLLYGNVGSDTITAGNGNNTIIGGQDSTDGADLITSGSGNDLILGNGGDDTVTAGGGADSLVGGYGNDALFGNQGNDLVIGNLGNDKLFGGQGSDTLYGGQGNDTLFGNAGPDLLIGGAGSDVFAFNLGDSTGSGGAGDVIADFQTGVDTIAFTQGPAATSLTFASTSVSTTSFAAIQTAAQTLIGNGDAYAFVTDGTDGFLFADENGDKRIDDTIKLSGAATTASLAATDIAVGAFA